MVVFGLFDLWIAGALLVFLAGSVVVCFLPARGTRLGRTGRVWLLVGSLSLTGLFVVFNVAYFNGFGTDPVMGSPTRAQVTGTWVGSGGARLVLRSDGTFTASRLPPYVGQTTDFPDMLLGRNPSSGHGTWVIGSVAFNGPDGVIFTFASDGVSFDLEAEKSSPPGGPALFYYLGDPDNWSDQYAFTRQ